MSDVRLTLGHTKLCSSPQGIRWRGSSVEFGFQIRDVSVSQAVADRERLTDLDGSVIALVAADDPRLTGLYSAVSISVQPTDVYLATGIMYGVAVLTRRPDGEDRQIAWSSVLRSGNQSVTASDASALIASAGSEEWSAMGDPNLDVVGGRITIDNATVNGDGYARYTPRVDQFDAGVPILEQLWPDGVWRQTRRLHRGMRCRVSNGLVQVTENRDGSIGLAAPLGATATRFPAKPTWSFGLFPEAGSDLSSVTLTGLRIVRQSRTSIQVEFSLLESSSATILSVTLDRGAWAPTFRLRRADQADGAFGTVDLDFPAAAGGVAAAPFTESPFGPEANPAYTWWVTGLDIDVTGSTPSSANLNPSGAATSTFAIGVGTAALVTERLGEWWAGVHMEERPVR